MRYLIAPAGNATAGNEGVGMGAVIMLGTLFGLIALIFALVLRFDPESRRPERPEVD